MGFHQGFRGKRFTEGINFHEPLFGGSSWRIEREEERYIGRLNDEYRQEERACQCRGRWIL
jgi:hypothetical protein